MNKCFLLGNITKDIEVRYTQGAEPMAVAKFTVAVSRKSKNAQGQYDSDFIRCIAFKNTAENIGKYFAKGSKIAIEGHITTGSYKKQDGTTVYTTDVTVDGFDFCEKAQAAPPQYATQYAQAPIDAQPAYTQPAPVAYPPEQAQEAVNAINQGFMGAEDEGIPFH